MEECTKGRAGGLGVVPKEHPHFLVSHRHETMSKLHGGDFREESGLGAVESQMKPNCEIPVG